MSGSKDTRKNPELIVADHRIIDGTGTDAVLAICVHKSIPVVFVSVSRDAISERLPDAFIVDKPFMRRELEAAIVSAFERPFQHQPSAD